MEIKTPYLLVVYGKDGCDKCVQLKNDVLSILENDAPAGEFKLDYQNLSTIDGMVAYAKSETVNGQRIPALQIMKYEATSDSYTKIPDTRPEVKDKKGSIFVPVYLQLQTDYSSSNPQISKEEIKELMTLAQTN